MLGQKQAQSNRFQAGLEFRWERWCSAHIRHNFVMKANSTTARRPPLREIAVVSGSPKMVSWRECWKEAQFSISEQSFLPIPLQTSVVCAILSRQWLINMCGTATLWNGARQSFLSWRNPYSVNAIPYHYTCKERWQFQSHITYLFIWILVLIKLEKSSLNWPRIFLIHWDHFHVEDRPFRITYASIVVNFVFKHLCHISVIWLRIFQLVILIDFTNGRGNGA